MEKQRVSEARVTFPYTANILFVVTLEECLDQIADAVLQVVLFQVEADENDSFLRHPDVSPLCDSIDLLVGLVSNQRVLLLMEANILSRQSEKLHSGLRPQKKKTKLKCWIVASF